MTYRDRKDIKRLYYFNNYLPNSLAKLYGLSHVRILAILKEDQNTTFSTAVECMLCSNDEDIQLFYIDGNPENNKPQNTITLCEADRRRMKALQLRRNKQTLIPQF